MRRFMFLTVFAITSGCVDFFERDVYVELPEHEPKIVVNSIIDPEDTVMRILVTKSVAIDSKDEVGIPLPDAAITLRVNGTPISDIYFDPERNYFLSRYQPQEGDAYEVIVVAAGYPRVQSETSLPKKVNVTKAVLSGKRYDMDGWEYQAVRFTMEDIPGERNFYEVSLLRVSTWENEETAETYTNEDEIGWLESPLSFLVDTDRGLAFSDASFENGSVDLEVWYDEYNSDDSELYILVRSATESYYEYMTTYYIHRWNQYPDLFSGEPVPMYSNIEGGYGIFSAFTTTEVKVVAD